MSVAVLTKPYRPLSVPDRHRHAISMADRDGHRRKIEATYTRQHLSERGAQTQTSIGGRILGLKGSTR
jgi:hypothetical protein